MRRVHVAAVRCGVVELGRAEAHHVRDVLRLGVGMLVEVFDSAGRSAEARIVRSEAAGVELRVEQVRSAAGGGLSWTVGSAVPKGARADWMVEKLCELGAERFVPLATARSVVMPGGQSKRQRWARLAAEAARQCGRTGVMAIEDLMEVGEFVKRMDGIGWYLSTGQEAVSVGEAVGSLCGNGESGAQRVRLSLLIGPEGGWTEQERAMFQKAGLTGVRLGGTILRVETAAVAAGVIAAAVIAPALGARG